VCFEQEKEDLETTVLDSVRQRKQDSLSIVTQRTQL